MAFQLRTWAHDIAILGKLSIGGVFELGFAGTTGTDRTIQAIGSQANISLDFIPKGTSTLRVPTSYETLVTNVRDIVNKGYVDSKLVGRAISSLLTGPTVAENGFSIVWDNANSRFTLASAAFSKTFGSGIEDVASVIKLGGVPLDRNTNITGTFDLNLGLTGSRLANIAMFANNKIEAIAGTGRVTVNGSTPIDIAGGSVASQFTIDAVGALTIADNQVGSGKRGLRGAADYSVNIFPNDYTQRVYVDSKLAGKNVSSLMTTPDANHHGHSVVWDFTNNRYTLQLITGGGGGGTSISKEETFTSDGINPVFTVLGTVTQHGFVDVGGNVQLNGVNYNRSGSNFDFGTPLPAGSKVTIHYFEDLSVGGGGGGDGHTIQNSGGSSLTQRENLRFQNGIDAYDIGGITTVKLGGTLTENTNFNGNSSFSIGASGLTAFNIAATQVALGAPLGSGITVKNEVGTHQFIIGESVGVLLNIGSDANGDTYFRDNGRLARIPIGIVGQVLSVLAGPTIGWANSTGSVTSGSGTNVTGTAVNLGGPLTANATLTGAFTLTLGTNASKLTSILGEASSTVSFVQGAKRIALADGIGVILDLGSDVTGDIYRRTSSGVLGRLPLSGANRVLGINAANNDIEYKAITTSSTAVANNIGLILTNPNSIEIGIPDASATVRGVVTTATQVFTGIKTFTNNNSATNAFFIDSGLTTGTKIYTLAGINYIESYGNPLVIKSPTSLGSLTLDGRNIELTSGAGSFSIRMNSTETGTPKTIVEIGSTFSNVISTSTALQLGITGNYSQTTGSTVVTQIAFRVSPTVNNSAAGIGSRLFGIYYSPVENNLTNTTHYGFVSTSTTALSGFAVAAPTALVHIGASTTARASLRIPGGTAPTSPNDGDIWQATNHLYVRLNGVTHQLDQQAGGGGSGTVTSIGLSGGTTGITIGVDTVNPITANGTFTLGGVLVAANGGTGQSTYAIGDLLQASSTTALSRLAAVATGNVLISGGVTTVSSWGKVGLTTHVSGILAGPNGGTGHGTNAVGDLLTGAATNTWNRIAAVAVGNVLISGGVTTAPSWGKVNLTTATHVTGQLPIANIAITGTPNGSKYLRDDGTWAAVPGGFTNGAGNTEVAIGDGAGNLVGSGVFSPSAGNLNLGASGGSGTVRTITANGTVSNIDLVLSTKGSGQLYLKADSFFNLGDATNANNTRVIQPSGSATDIILSLRSQGSAAIELVSNSRTLFVDGYTTTGVIRLKFADDNTTDGTGTHAYILAGDAPNGTSFGGNILIQSGNGNTDGFITLNPRENNIRIGDQSSTTTSHLFIIPSFNNHSVRFSGGQGNATTLDGTDVTLTGGNAYTTGNNSGGHICFQGGTGNGTGAGGNIIFNAVGMAGSDNKGASRTLVIYNRTAEPSAATTDGIFLYAADSGDSTSTLSLFLEQQVVAIGTFTPSHKVKIKINGVEYWWQLDQV